MGCILIGFAISFIFASLPVFPYTAQGFLSAIAKNQEAQAYEMLSASLQKKYNVPTFRAIMEQSGVKAYYTVKWTRNVTDSSNKRGFVAGVMITKDKKEYPIRIEFIQVGNTWIDKGWRINGIIIRNVKISGDQEMPAAPQPSLPEPTKR